MTIYNIRIIFVLIFSAQFILGMTTKILTSSSIIKHSAISVEVDINNHGLPSFEIVGLGDKTVEESKARVRASINNSQFNFPSHHVTVNLTPADLKKEGSHFDLAISIGILAASGQININQYQNWLYFGESNLDGQLTLSKNILPELLSAINLGYKDFFIPKIFESEIKQSFINANIIFAESLSQVCRILIGTEEPLIHINNAKYILNNLSQSESDLDFKYIRGQALAKRALEIAAAGRHNVLFYGPPGTGKTLLSKTFPTILPDLTEEEAKEVYSIFIDAGLEQKRKNYFAPPFRSPHHSASLVGIVGGGPHTKPGELSLAHKGVLFLDEMAEFPRSILESIRQPIEDQEILISRSGNKITFPADFILIGSTNPCPCGYFKNPLRSCTCSFSQLEKYRKKLSGPILDRIDIFVSVNDLPPSAIISKTQEEPSSDIKKRIKKSQEFGKRRNNNIATYNSRISNKNLIEQVNFVSSDLDFFLNTVDKLNISPRSVCKILKVSRTIADLASSDKVNKNHFSEALAFKMNLPTLS